MGLPVPLPGRRRRASSSMRAALALLPLLAAAQALHRGKAYVREKVCQEYKILGKENFRTLTIIDTSRKYSNGTFQEIGHLVREIVSLAETCCADGADPSCYDAGSTALSEKSCAADSPFPAHPGAARCCGQQGLERKLCLAALRHPPQPLPRFLQPSDSELCHAFRLEPREFADRFLYEYASSYSQAPLPVLLASTTTFLSMVSTCCISPTPTACFLKEKRERKTLSLLTLTSNRICSRFSAYGKDKATLSSLTSLAQKIPTASFEELLPLAEDAAEVACQCCDSMAEDCMQKKLLEHTARVCSALSVRDERFAACCQGKNLMENHFCILAMPPAPATRLPELPEPTNKELCAKEGALHATRFLFEVARRHPSLPEAVLAKLYDTSGKLRGECCSSKDPSACWDSKRQRIAAELFPFLTKADQLCGQFHKLPFLEFKKRLRDSLAQSEPSSAPLEQLLEQRASFASSCCLPDAPLLLCASKVTSELGELCQGDSCLLG
ncbi:vitamin D-binding protein [Ammospiza nelsoni]|uniref:vitamin D-binding protein n=1 Tax=Ammospiza caudacuta TaxID=2857398 RepID=UPI0027392A6E|nr:vitamin D-binding protein [Ammospiza caudacuta]XP_059327362.1 vitamin D-binding protein [Ammospiza nelsoni]